LSRLPRYEEMVTHGESAYFVDISPDSIAHGVVRMLDDAPLRERIASTGREIVAIHADFARDVDRVEMKYYELLAATRRRPGFIQRARMIGEMVRYLTTSGKRGEA
jgi:glycosyltransferase involved in cell wall biosynthesis